MEDFMGLMDKMNEADAVECRETDFSPQNYVVVVNIAPQWHLYKTFIAGMKRLVRLLNFFHFVGQTNSILCSMLVHVKHPYASRFIFSDVENISDAVLHYILKLIKGN